MNLPLILNEYGLIVTCRFSLKAKDVGYVVTVPSFLAIIGLVVIEIDVAARSLVENIVEEVAPLVAALQQVLLMEHIQDIAGVEVVLERLVMSYRVMLFDCIMGF